MLKPIQTEIRFADLLALYKTQDVKYFICHNLAFMLKDKLAENEGFVEEFTQMGEQSRNDGLPELANSACYYYIYLNSEKSTDFCAQVVAQLNHYISKIFPRYNLSDLFEHNLPDYILNACLPNSEGLWFQEFQFKSRLALLEKIVEFDPDAVISINL
jgi:hypothetical protein